MIFISGIKCNAVFIGNSGYIALAACYGVAVRLEDGEQRVCGGIISIVHAGVVSGKIGEGCFKCAAGNIYSYAYLLCGGVYAVFTLYGYYGRYGLFIELRKLCIVRVAFKLFVVFCILGIRKNAVNLNLGVVFGLSYKKVFALYNRGNAGAEAAIFFGSFPSVYVVGFNAVEVIIIHVTDELVSGSIGNNFNKAPHIAGDIISCGVCLFDALPVNFLGADHLHKCGSIVKLFLCKGKNRKL